MSPISRILYIGLVVLFSSHIFAAVDELGIQVRGEIAYNVYNTKSGALTKSLPGTCALLRRGNMFQVRLVDPSLTPYRHQILTSDGTDIYTSDMFLPEGERPSMAWAQFETGPMPIRPPRWGIVQAFTLAALVTENPERCLEGNSLRAQFIPELLTRRSQGRADSIRTEIIRGDSGSVNTIIFWTEPQKHVSSTSPYRTAFTLARLDILASTSQFPTKIAFRNYTQTPDERGALVTRTTSEYLFDGSPEPLSSEPHFDDLSWDRKIKVTVNDYRFSKNRPGFYVLTPGEPLPFRANASYSRITAVQAAEAITKSHNILKSTCISVAIGLTCTFFGVYITRAIKKKPNENEI